MPTETTRIILNAESDAERFDQFLAAKLPAFSRARVQILIKEGFATINGTTAKPSSKIRAGDQIEVTEPPPTPSEVLPQEIPLTILFEDPDLVVIDKPAGLVVHPAAGNPDGTLVNALLHHCEDLSGIGGVERPGIVHRLDKETSGCLVVAKNDVVHRALIGQFAGREVTKIYLALAAGRFPRLSGEIREPIGRHPVHRQKMAVVERGRASHTSWRILKELPCGSLVECTLHTGRTHQIRVHLKHLGHPVLGDELYGKRGAFQRQMLHAWKLGFTHPASGKPMEFTAPIPPDFVAAGVPAEL